MLIVKSSITAACRVLPVSAGKPWPPSAPLRAHYQQRQKPNPFQSLLNHAQAILSNPDRQCPRFRHGRSNTGIDERTSHRTLQGQRSGRDSPAGELLRRFICRHCLRLHRSPLSVMPSLCPAGQSEGFNLQSPNVPTSCNFKQRVHSTLKAAGLTSAPGATT